MSERVQKSKSQQKREETVAEAPVKTTDKEKTEQELKDELDALLADIDEALGENLECAQEFMSNWIQKGGE